MDIHKITNQMDLVMTNYSQKFVSMGTILPNHYWLKGESFLMPEIFMTWASLRELALWLS